MAKPVLVIMAAGVGSRFGGGGMKQVAPVDDHGHIMMDYTIFDAVRAGFETVVCVIKPGMEKDFDETIGKRVKGRVELRYAFQTMDAFMPADIEIPAERAKPWGTAHAALCAKSQVNGPFVAVNADDYYGPEAFRLVYEHLTTHGETEHCMAGYAVENTLTENGTVARGVCVVNANGFLSGITERTKIMRRDDGSIVYIEEDGETVVPEGTIVSLNMWGFGASMMDELEARFDPFLRQNLPVNPLKCEYFLPFVPDCLIRENKGSVQVLKTHDRWYGMTYREDLPSVREALKELRESGLYPENLWR
ncbi:MAG: nucleotidyltransferase [Clostridiales bacterium]|nr:nucleotidyltransferase [Clostridiales bacterium]